MTPVAVLIATALNSSSAVPIPPTPVAVACNVPALDIVPLPRKKTAVLPPLTSAPAVLDILPPAASSTPTPEAVIDPALVTVPLASSSMP